MGIQSNFLNTYTFYNLELFVKREALKGLRSNFVGFPEAKSAKNSPVTGPSLNPLPIRKGKNLIFFS